MAGIFDNALEAVSARLGTLTAGSPFGENPLGGANPFSGSQLKAGSPFGGNAFGNGGSPFNSPLGGGGSPFGANPFGVGGSPFGNPFGAGNSPFSSNPFGRSGNPYNGTPEDPFGTGVGGYPKAGDDTTFDGAEFSPSTYTGQEAAAWVRSTRNGSPLADIAPQIVEYARSRGVDPGMLFGVLLKESQLGADNGMGTRQNNPGNIMAPGADPANGKIVLRSYGSMLEGVKAMVDLFANYGATYGAKTVEDMIATYYVGPEAYKRFGLDANDAGGSGAGGNGTVRDYLSKFVYPTMQQFGATKQGGTPRSGNWELIAKSFTREGGGWVDYTNGGIRVTGNPKDGMDCSSFTGYVLGLDRNIWNAQAQADAAMRNRTFGSEMSKMKKGDLIFFQGTNPGDPSARPVTHVGIYLGNGQMIHTGTPGRGVEVVSLNTDYWKSHFYGYGRL